MSQDPRRVVYRERGRTYASSLLLLLVLLGGFTLDLSFGAGRAHLVGWLVAAVIVVGADAMIVRAARQFRSVSVTETHLQVGEQSLDRSEIIGIDHELNLDLPILGRRPGESIPRGWSGLVLHVSDGKQGKHIVVPSRHPDRLAIALEAALDVPDIRQPEPAELETLGEIAERSLSLYRVAGIQLPPMSFPADKLRENVALLCVGRPPVGFVRVDEVDGLAHIEELAVLPARMHRGLGGSLLEAACDWAREHGYPAITVIAFADVPWNAPFNAAHGFAEITELTPELAELRDWETSMGLERLGRRIVMRRDL